MDGVLTRTLCIPGPLLDLLSCLFLTFPDGPEDDIQGPCLWLNSHPRRTHGNPLCTGQTSQQEHTDGNVAV